MMIEPRPKEVAEVWPIEGISDCGRRTMLEIVGWCADRGTRL